MNVRWNSLTRPQWEAFHRLHGGSLQQAWAYGDAMASLGVTVQRAAIFDGAELVGLAQFIARRWLAYIGVASCSRGPVWSEAAGGDFRAKACRRMQKTVPIRPLRVALFSPDVPPADLLPGELSGLHRVLTGYATVVLDLRLDDAQLLRRLHPTWRNKLNKASWLKTLSVAWGAGEAGLAQALRLEDGLRRERGFQGLPTAFVRAYVGSHDRPQQAVLVGQVRQGKEVLASVLMLLHGRLATYHLGWASEAGKSMHLHNSLIWQALPLLRERGITHLDLGGINTHQLPGISRFKICTGGEVRHLAGTYF